MENFPKGLMCLSTSGNYTQVEILTGNSSEKIHVLSMNECNIAILFPFTARELGCGAFGKVFLADALGIVAFNPRRSTKRRSRRRFGGSVRLTHYVTNNKMTKVAVKTLKGILRTDVFWHCRRCR